jgi:hypothetical protein
MHYGVNVRRRLILKRPLLGSLAVGIALVVLIETHSLPTLVRCYPRQLYLDHSHCLVLAPATLAALPPTRAISQTRVFYVSDPSVSFRSCTS